MSQLPYRPNVCMLVQNRAGHLFLGQRAGEPSVWQFPQGGVEEGLTLEENVLKELHEELGADRSLFKIVRKLVATNAYDFEKPPSYAVGKWRGQSQSFWLVNFLGVDSAINLNRFTPEFQDFKWCTLEEVKALAEPKRLPGYLKALAEISDLS